MHEIKKGSYVEIKKTLLQPSERAERLPEDTKRVPFEARIRGFLVNDASVGQEVEIETSIGRNVKGTLVGEFPPFKHGFGRPVKELLEISRETRKEIFSEIWGK